MAHVHAYVGKTDLGNGDVVTWGKAAQIWNEGELGRKKAADTRIPGCRQA